MPRRERMYIPGLPYHIVQRGNNREACFIETDNYQHYLDLWQEMAKRYGVAVHAYCLMTNHIHILATPETEEALSTVMQVVNSRYARYINVTYRRTGTLWEGRHRSSLVQTENYLLLCYRYIELNPVRASMVKRPEHYRWSSYGINAWGDPSWLRPHDEYIRLGQTQAERCHAYRALFESELSYDDLHQIREAAHYSQPVGNVRFKQQIEKQYGINLGHSKRGRPCVKEEGFGVDMSGNAYMF